MRIDAGRVNRLGVLVAVVCLGLTLAAVVFIGQTVYAAFRPVHEQTATGRCHGALYRLSATYSGATGRITYHLNVMDPERRTWFAHLGSAPRDEGVRSATDQSGRARLTQETGDIDGGWKRTVRFGHEGITQECRATAQAASPS